MYFGERVKFEIYLAFLESRRWKLNSDDLLGNSDVELNPISLNFNKAVEDSRILLQDLFNYIKAGKVNQ